MTAFSLFARLHLGANSRLALSLPQSSPLNPERLDSSLLRGSRGGAARRERSQYAATRIIYKNVARPAPHVFSTKRIAIVEKMQSDESKYEESKK